MISQEHHGFLSTLMSNVYHLFYDLGNFSSLECLEILILFARNTVLVVVVSLIDNILSTELVSDFFLKLL